MDLSVLLITWGVACPLCFGIVLGVRRWTLKKHILDIPNERSSHTRPTPRGGGLGIVSVTLALFAASLLFGRDMTLVLCIAYITFGGLLAAVGWIDDRQTVPVAVRFSLQFCSALGVVLVSGPILRIEVPPLGVMTLGTMLSALLAVVWITGFTNMFNFMDGIDGLAGTQAVIAGIGWMVIFLTAGQQSLAFLAGLLAATSLGFLFLNVPPARIFMGDVGSTFLGFTLAVLPVLGYRQTQDARLFFTGILFVAPFAFDSGFTMLRRALQRENIFQAHRSHLYQHLVLCGYSHGQVTTLYGVLALASVLSGMAYYEDPERVGFIAMLLVSGLFVSLTVFVVSRKLRTAGQSRSYL